MGPLISELSKSECYELGPRTIGVVWHVSEPILIPDRASSPRPKYASARKRARPKKIGGPAPGMVVGWRVNMLHGPSARVRARSHLSTIDRTGRLDGPVKMANFGSRPPPYRARLAFVAIGFGKSWVQ